MLWVLTLYVLHPLGEKILLSNGTHAWHEDGPKQNPISCELKEFQAAKEGRSWQEPLESGATGRIGLDA